MQSEPLQKDDSKNGAALFEQAQGGCRQSLNLLMARHEGLVHAVIRQQYLGDLPYEQALQAGRTALWRAIMGYDPKRGTAFSTYAWTSIMRAVWAAVKRHPNESELLSLAEDLEDEGQEPVRLWEAQVLRITIAEVLAHLPARLQRVMRWRYGCGGVQPATFRQIGQGLAVSKQRAHQLHREALIRLRQPALSYPLRELLGRHTVEDYEATAVETTAWLQQRRGRHT